MEEREGQYSYPVTVFKKGTPPEKKRGLIGFLIYFIVVVLATVWPIYLIGNRVEPYVLGMPFSMFWIAMCVMAGLVGMIFLYRFEKRWEG